MGHRAAKKVRKEIRRAIRKSDMRDYLDSLELQVQKGKELLSLLQNRNAELEFALAQKGEAGPIQSVTPEDQAIALDVPDMLETT